MNKELELTEESIEKPVKHKETKKKFTVKLVTASSIIYDDDDGISRFISKKGFEDLKIGDTFKV